MPKLIAPNAEFGLLLKQTKQATPELFFGPVINAAYRAPRAMAYLPCQSKLHSKEPFGPIDSMELMDRGEKLVGK